MLTYWVDYFALQQKKTRESIDLVSRDGLLKATMWENIFSLVSWDTGIPANRAGSVVM